MRGQNVGDSALEKPRPLCSILVVEPSRSQRVLRTAQLERVGCRVFTLSDFQDVPALMARDRVDVICIGAEAPGGGAMSRIRAWRSDPKFDRTAIFVFEWKPRPVRVAALRSAGASDVLDKTISLAKLREHLQRMSFFGAQVRPRVDRDPGDLRTTRIARDRGALIDRIERDLAKQSGSTSLLLLHLDDQTDLKFEFGRVHASKLMEELIDFLTLQLRECDFVARHTGSEMAVLLSNTTQQQAGTTLQRILFSIQSRAWERAKDPSALGISWGTSTLERGSGFAPGDLLVSCARSLLSNRQP